MEILIAINRILPILVMSMGIIFSSIIYYNSEYIFITFRRILV
nr:MAG TPA: hypothetical protein [Caudoviricetes sp.]DAS32631.1 MAG TPA: hypothetical protein [Caudoviricetes sp.]